MQHHSYPGDIGRIRKAGINLQYRRIALSPRKFHTRCFILVRVALGCVDAHRPCRIGRWCRHDNFTLQRWQAHCVSSTTCRHQLSVDDYAAVSLSKLGKHSRILSSVIVTKPTSMNTLRLRTDPLRFKYVGFRVVVLKNCVEGWE
jgi:hypothetical protein